VNDANDITAVLAGMGFTVHAVLNGSLAQMENGIDWLTRRLRADENSLGLFYFAGHGVQSGGDNFLIPVDVNIRNDTQLRLQSISVQSTLNDMNDAGNELNIMILDACRDNPFGWSRSSARGLVQVSPPAGSIVVYATSSNSTANDGTGRNGLFTGELLRHLPTPGLSIQEIFNRTGRDVSRITDGMQHPEISVRHFGASSMYFVPANK